MFKRDIKTRKKGTRFNRSKSFSDRLLVTLGKGRRRAFATFAAIMVFAFLITGTYAWYATQFDLNLLSHEGADKSAVLHNDSDGRLGKQVYVENTSEATDIYVRVKLLEYLDLTSWNERDLESITWTTHIPEVAVGSCGLANNEQARFHDHFTWDMEGTTWYVPEPVGTSGMVSKPGVDDTDPLATETPEARIILMSEYKSLTILERIMFKGWVYDTDGWAYWSQPLAPESATGLLLNSVSKTSSLDGKDYFYAVNAIMEAVDPSDLEMWTVPSGNNDGLGQPSVTNPEDQSSLATSDAIEMLTRISTPGMGIERIEVATAPTKTKYVPGTSFDSSGLTLKVIYTNEEEEIITSGFACPTSALADGTKQVNVTYGGVTTAVPVTVNYLVDLHLKAPNTNVIIDGISWQVVYKTKLEGSDYVLLTTTNTVGAIPHNSLKNSMTSYYTNTIGSCTTLMTAVVVPSFNNTSYISDGNLIDSRQAFPTAVLAKDKPAQTSDVAFALDHREIGYVYGGVGWKPNNGTNWWLYTKSSATTHAFYFNSSGQDVGVPEPYPSNVGYRPSVWVKVP